MSAVSSENLPVLGAAMPVPVLEELAGWIIESQRDLELQDFIKGETLNGDEWRQTVTRARQLLSGYTGRMGIHGPFWGFSIATEDTEIREIVVKRMNQGLDVCAELDGTHMVVHSPYSTWDHNNLDNYPGARQGVVDRVHAVLDGIVPRAEALGVEIVIENIQDVDPAIRVDLARSFDSPMVRVSIDTGHAHYAHVTTGAPPVDRYVIAAGEMLGHVHLQDADGYADRHWAPGDGTVLWPSIFKAIGDLKTKPRLIIELRNHSEILKGAQHLIDLGLAR